LNVKAQPLQRLGLNTFREIRNQQVAGSIPAVGSSRPTGRENAMHKRLSILCFLFCLPALGGCFDVEQALTLEKDMSGKAVFSMKVDMEPMVLFMLRMQREMQGTPGEPTAAEIEKAKQDFLASKKTETEGAPERQVAEIEENLPPGVKLLDSSVNDEGLEVAVRLAFGFDHLSKLTALQLSKKDEEEGSPGPKNPFDRPFAGLRLEDEGKTFLLVGEAVNPAAEQKEQTAEMNLSPEMKEQMEDAFEGLRVAFEIEAPFEVVETNATGRRGRTLVWEYTLDSLQKMTPEQLAQGVMVRYKK
jgi:hypothetical protein